MILIAESERTVVKSQAYLGNAGSVDFWRLDGADDIVPRAGGATALAHIAQMTLWFDDSAPGFWYKNHYVIGGFGVLIWLTRWVNRKRGF